MKAAELAAELSITGSTIGGKSLGSVRWSEVAQACLMASVTLLMTAWVVLGIGIDWAQI